MASLSHKQLRQMAHKLPLTASQWSSLPINFCKLLIQPMICLFDRLHSSLKRQSTKALGVPDHYWGQASFQSQVHSVLAKFVWVPESADGGKDGL